ncbi:MAG: hypothetical protein Q4F95_14415 [Oscillospiraceae bacterium]|nr:hypothetical protein [Oscillospiraceae bacterium]
MKKKKDIRKNTETAEKPKKHITLKKRILVLVILLILCTVCILIVFSMRDRQGIMITHKLEKKIGCSTDEAVKYAHIDKNAQSEQDIMPYLSDYAYMYEDDKNVKISGINIPKWAVYFSEDVFGNLTDVAYYDYSVLKKSVYGIKKKKRFDTGLITTGMKETAAEKILKMDAYCVIISGDKKIKKFKYYYEDKASDNVEALCLTVIYNSDNTVSAPLIEEKNNLILDILKTSE